jgi:mRNA interferase MazF
MQRNYSNFEQGNIAIADLLFSEQIGIKRRPVLIISNTEYNKLSEDIIALKITSSYKRTKFSITLNNEDLEKGKLKVSSQIMADFPSTIQKNLISQTIAKISKQKLLEIKQKTKELYKL